MAWLTETVWNSLAEWSRLLLRTLCGKHEATAAVKCTTLALWTDYLHMFTILHLKTLHPTLWSIICCSVPQLHFQKKEWPRAVTWGHFMNLEQIHNTESQLAWFWRAFDSALLLTSWHSSADLVVSNTRLLCWAGPGPLTLTNQTVPPSAALRGGDTRWHFTSIPFWLIYYGQCLVNSYFRCNIEGNSTCIALEHTRSLSLLLKVNSWSLCCFMWNREGTWLF